MIRWGVVPRNATLRAVVLSARKHGVSFGKAPGKRVVLEKNGKRIEVGGGGGGSCSLNDREMVRICKNKEKSKDILKGFGCNVTKGKAFLSSDEKKSMDFLREVKYPIYLKPVYGSKGRGVYRISNFDAAALKLSELRRRYKKILVEEEFYGEEYRFLCVFGKVVAVVHRRPASVLGDGKHTIDELIEATNKSRSRKKALPPIKVDAHLFEKISRQGLSMSSVPSMGERIYLRDNSNVSMGGDSINVSDEMDKSYIDKINLVASKFDRLAFSGWDVLIDNISNKADENNWAVIEINDSPMLSLHHYPAEGKSVDVAGIAIKKIFADTKKPSYADNIELKISVDSVLEKTSDQLSKWAKRTSSGMGVNIEFSESNGQVGVLVSGSSRWVGEACAQFAVLCKSYGLNEVKFF